MEVAVGEYPVLNEANGTLKFIGLYCITGNGNVLR